MRLRRTLFRAVNRALGTANLTLTPFAQDFDARLDSPAQLDRMHRAFAAAWRDWVASQDVVTVRGEIDLAKELPAFFDAYLGSPFRDQTGGSRYNNLLFLFLVARAARPAVIVDSGTYTGASAWALRLGAPGARVLSFDIDLSRLQLRLLDVEYVERDWTSVDYAGLPTREGLCYFDDHLDQARRLLEARERGFPLAIFDDDFPVTSVATIAGEGVPLPKIEFLLDDELRTERELSWTIGGKRYAWPVDAAYLDRARDAIARTGRLPNTSCITNIHQTPYRIVAVKPPA